MNAKQNNTKRRDEGQIEARIRQWIDANITGVSFSLRDVCRIAMRVDGALSLGFSGGLARTAIRSFVRTVLAERGQELLG